MVSQTGAEPCPSRPDDTISRENDPPCRASAADLKFPDRIAATAHPSAPNPSSRTPCGMSVRQVTAA